MPVFISLGNSTDQGIRNVKDRISRAEAVEEMIKQAGGLAAALGNVRSTTRTAFDKVGFTAIVGRAG